jgi:hypothetical protein
MKTVEEALELLKDQITWIQYVRENEFTSREAQRLIQAAERATEVIQKLNRKYNS